MAVPMVQGAVSGEWSTSTSRDARPKQEVLRLWDESTAAAQRPVAADSRRSGSCETLTAFGQYTDALHNLILYVIDNEIHHRGQGYVYLRALGIEPPAFYDRS